MTLTLPERIVAVHESLLARHLPHAFGGALALAWCTQRARGTIDIDVNVFVDAEQAAVVLAALPEGVEVSPDQIDLARRDGQVRVWWERTPVDVFLDTTDFHVEVATRVRFETLLGVPLPFLSCRDLAVFKAFFDRTKDWADLEEMAEAGALDRPAVVGVLLEHLGADDHRIERLRSL